MISRRQLDVSIDSERLEWQKDVLTNLRAGTKLTNYFMGYKLYDMPEMWEKIYFYGVFINHDYNYLLSEYQYLNPLF